MMKFDHFQTSSNNFQQRRNKGRFVLCCFSFRDITFNISCLYAPNRNPARNDFFEERPDSTVL